MSDKKHKTKSSQSRLTRLAHTVEGYTRSFDGTRLWYKSQGSGPPMVCCNGLACSTIFFKYIEDYFKRSHQVITFDYRGHGLSDPPNHRRNHSFQCLVRDLKAVMDKLKVKKAILLGYSIGSQVIYEFYTNYPKRCAALVSCFGTFEKPADNFFDFSLSKYIFEGIYIFNHIFPRLANMTGTLMVKNPFWFQLGSLLQMMKPYLVDKKIIKQYVDHIVRVDPVFLAKLAKSLQEHSALPNLKKIKVPTLIFGADEDQFSPVWVSKKMHYLIPNSELCIIKKGSHVAMVEQPELINLRLEKFFSDRVHQKKISTCQ